jgi:hypothetical protein
MHSPRDFGQPPENRENSGQFNHVNHITSSFDLQLVEILNEFKGNYRKINQP